ncbi:hypothetical protein, partial [Klebsiella pneumoniae]|uniref:hypothetical protein n=1 Tax=Klebsiella pneumoniae TaxID=573 RepID=UPI003F82647E
TPPSQGGARCVKGTGTKQGRNTADGPYVACHSGYLNVNSLGVPAPAWALKQHHLFFNQDFNPFLPHMREAGERTPTD